MIQELASARRRLIGPVCAGLVLLRLAYLFLWIAAEIPTYPDRSFPEGALVARAIDVAEGRSPYHDWRQWPHAFAPYPPLAYYPVGWLARAFAPHPAPHQVYMVGRLFSFTMVIGIFGLIFLFARRLGMSRLWSLIAVAAMGECQNLLDYCTSYRPDAPKVFFAFLALWLMLRPRPGWRTLAGVAAALYVAMWFKPTAWAVGVLAAWWCWRNFGARRALAAGAAFAAAGLIPLWLLDCHWHGLLLLNIVDSLRNGMTLGGIWGFLTGADIEFRLILLLGLVVAVDALRRPEFREQRLLLAAVPVALAASLLQMLKVGGDINYLLDIFPLAALMMVWCGNRLWFGHWRLRPALNEFLLWVVVIPCVVWMAWINFSAVRDDSRILMMSWRPAPLQREVAAARGPVLTTSPFIALTRPEPTILDFFQYSVLSRRGMLDNRPLLERIQRREFGIAMMSTSLMEGHRAAVKKGEDNVFFCPGFLAALEANYGVIWQNKGFTAMRPK